MSANFLPIIDAVLPIFEVGADFRHFLAAPIIRKCRKHSLRLPKIADYYADYYTMAYAYVKIQSPVFSEEHGGSASIPPWVYTFNFIKNCHYTTLRIRGMPICVLVGEHGVNTGNFCGLGGKNTVMQAISSFENAI